MRGFLGLRGREECGSGGGVGVMDGWDGMEEGMVGWVYWYRGGDTKVGKIERDERFGIYDGGWGERFVGSRSL